MKWLAFVLMCEVACVVILGIAAVRYASSGNVFAVAAGGVVVGIDACRVAIRWRLR